MCYPYYRHCLSVLVFLLQGCLLKGLCLTSLLLVSQVQAEEVVEEVEVVQALYVQIRPAFVTNFVSDNLVYIRADVAIRVGTAPTVAAVEQHMDAIKHAIVMLLSRQEQDNVNNPEGVLSIREEALEAVVEVLESEGEPADVLEVLFTSFIIE